MNDNDEQKLRSDCNQTSRFRSTRWLGGHSVDALALDAKESKLVKLPFNCLQHILSFMTYEKVSKMRQVSKRFNEISKKLLDEGHKELEKRLKIEIARAEKMVLFPNNARSYDMLHFLNGLHEAIHNCTKAYLLHVNFFVAGKLLDEVNCLLTDFNSSTVVPYLQENIYDQKPHPLLVSIIAHSKRAYRHFYCEILEKFINVDEEADSERNKKNYLQAKLLLKQNEMRIPKINLLKNQRQKIDCGNQMNRELFKLILKLNENVLNLTQWTKKVDAEVEREINGVNTLDKERSNCCIQLSTSLLLRDTKVMRIPGSKQTNLSSLPSYCIQNIVSYLNCNKMAQLRIVCKSFNEACKKELNQEFEKLNQKFKFQIKYNEQMHITYPCNSRFMHVYIMKDLYSLLQQCEDVYKCCLGPKYYFVAGNVLDEAKRIYVKVNNIRTDLDYNYYKSRPYYDLFPLMNMIYMTVAYLKFKISPKHFLFTQKQIYVPDCIITGDAMDFEKEHPLNLEEIEMLMEKADFKIKEQNDKNKKLLKIISGLKKKVIILNKEISERVDLLQKMKIKFIN